MALYYQVFHANSAQETLIKDLIQIQCGRVNLVLILLWSLHQKQ